MPQTIATFLMFQNGRAEEAMRFYTELFPDGEVQSVQQYPAGQGTGLLRGQFRIAGQNFACTDSSVEHKFDFTPSISIFVDCEDAADLDRLVEALAKDGATLMPPDDYGFSQKFAWIQDRFGVSWQLNLPHN